MYGCIDNYNGLDATAQMAIEKLSDHFSKKNKLRKEEKKIAISQIENAVNHFKELNPSTSEKLKSLKGQLTSFTQSKSALKIVQVISTIEYFIRRLFRKFP